MTSNIRTRRYAYSGDGQFAVLSAAKVEVGDALVNLGRVVAKEREGVFVRLTVHVSAPDLNTGLIHEIPETFMYHETVELVIH